MHSKEAINSDYIPFPNPDVILEEEEGGKVVLINFDTGNAISLNAVGRFIWETADGNLSVAEIIEKIELHFLAAPSDISKDVIRLVNILKLNGFFGSEIKGGQPQPPWS